jgi:hypothetical protein
MRRGLVLLVLTVIATGCGSEGDSAARPAGTDSSVSGTTLDGDAVSLGDFKGKPVFVNVWSSW